MPLYDFVKKYNTITIFYSLIVWCFIPYPQYSTPFNGGKHNVTTICNRHCHRSGDYIYWLYWWPWPLISTGCCSCPQPVTDGGGELPLAWPASEGHPLDGRCPHGIPVSHSARTGVSVQVRCIVSKMCLYLNVSDQKITNAPFIEAIRWLTFYNIKDPGHSHRCVFGGWTVTAFFWRLWYVATRES